MITLKIPIEVDDEARILKYQQEYSALLHVYFNRYLEGMSQKDCKHLQLNNVELLDSWFRQRCIYETMALVDSLKTKQKVYEQKMQRKQSRLCSRSPAGGQALRVSHLQKMRQC